MFSDPHLISIVGSDRIGKNTQSHLLKSFIEKNIVLKTKTGSRSAKAVVVEVPYKYSLTFPLIFVMLKLGLASKFPRFFQFIQFLNKYFLQLIRLPYYLFCYDFVIFDRWADCGYVYGLATGVKENSFILKLTKLLIRTDKTIALLGSPHDGVIDHRDEYEANSTLQNNVRKLYKEWALKNKGTTSIINANQDIIDVHKDIVSFIFGNEFISK
jgi:thymidylate kinase